MSVSPANLGPVWVLQNSGNAFDIMSSIHEGDFTLLFMESHDVSLNSAINPGQNMLHLVRTRNPGISQLMDTQEKRLLNAQSLQDFPLRPEQCSPTK